MRIVGIDPGAERCGWAVVDEQRDQPVLMGSGVFTTPRNGEEFQPYRMRVEVNTFARCNKLFYAYSPDWIAVEIIPAVGGGNFAVATQSYLANCVATAVHLVAHIHAIDIKQIAARTVHKKIALKAQTKHVTKAQVKRGLYRWYPELEGRALVPDESDAIAIATASYLIH